MDTYLGVGTCKGHYCNDYVLYHIQGLKALDASIPKRDGSSEHIESVESELPPVNMPTPANSNGGLGGKESEANTGGSTSAYQTGGQLAESTEAGSSHSRPSGSQEEGHDGSMEKDHQHSDETADEHGSASSMKKVRGMI